MYATVPGTVPGRKVEDACTPGSSCSNSNVRCSCRARIGSPGRNAPRKASPWLKSIMPLRSGHPPGYRRKPIHEVDEILTECDWLAWEAMKPDTS